MAKFIVTIQDEDLTREELVEILVGESDDYFDPDDISVEIHSEVQAIEQEIELDEAKKKIEEESESTNSGK